MVTLVCVGRPMPMFSEPAKEYAARINRYTPFETLETPKAKRPGDKAEEASAILRRIPKGAYVIAMEVGGKRMTSEAFASLLNDRRMDGRGACFIIGGAFGLDKSISERADMLISLSDMTLSHDIARIALLEQIYRGCTILAGESYHK